MWNNSNTPQLAPPPHDTRGALRREKLALYLSPYCQKMPWRKNLLSRSSSATAITSSVEKKRICSAMSLRRSEPQGTAIDRSVTSLKGSALSHLSHDEWSICNLMVDLLQRKSRDEAEHIIAAVSKMALSRRLLARYSGVYGGCCGNGDASTTSAVDESGRAQLIRYLQQQQQQQQQQFADDEKDNYCGESERRARLKKMFERGGGTEFADNASSDVKSTRRFKAARSSSTGGGNVTRPRHAREHGSVDSRLVAGGAASNVLLQKERNRRTGNCHNGVISDSSALSPTPGVIRSFSVDAVGRGSGRCPTSSFSVGVGDANRGNPPKEPKRAHPRSIGRCAPKNFL